MRILAIETASEACSVALFEGKTFASASLIAHDHRELGRGHAERLIPMIAELPGKGQADRLLVSLGPGSFTGVRVGLAAARALGVAWKAEVLGYPTLALIAAMAQLRMTRALTVCVNGGHGEWFVQDFDASGLPQNDLASLTPEHAQERQSHGFLAGNRARDLADLKGGASEVLETLPDARFALQVPQELLTGNLAPLYGRAPDAKPQIQRATR